jgi:UDP-N-acetylglucosamine 4-epimerase
LELGQRITVFDNFSTGSSRNLDEVRDAVGPAAWASVEILEGDLRNPESCAMACAGVDLILHQAAIASVPASLEDPVTTHEVNVTGTMNIFNAARRAGVRRVVYASSSAVYGTDEAPVKQEEITGRLLSPYAASKAICEVYGETFSQCYGLEAVGLRYFNVFGPRQDPAGPYAAVIPLWIQAALRGTPLFVNGDGSTSRDFISVRNVVQANLQAALAPANLVAGEAFNIGSGLRIDLNTLIREIAEAISREFPGRRPPETVYREFRAGDIQHSLADISKARRCLAFDAQVSFQEALGETLAWFARETEQLAI